MRKVWDHDAELKALNDKARALKARKVEQLGALVVATGVDALDLEVIAGLLRHGVMEAKLDSVMGKLARRRCHVSSQARAQDWRRC